jgi:hypothetical protein
MASDKNLFKSEFLIKLVFDKRGGERIYILYLGFLH